MSEPTPAERDRALGAEYCEFCGAEQPCRRRACLEALAAQAEYWDEEANPIKPEGWKPAR